MTRILDVYLHQHLMGKLRLRDGQMVFEYAEEWLRHPSAMALSHSLPLKGKKFNRKQCRGFFAGLLPEQEKRLLIARRLGVSEQNDFGLLEALGGECAGAVTLMREGEALPARDYRYTSLPEERLAALLRELPERPLMAGEQGVRLSLAGAQDKIAVRVDDAGKISLPLGLAPSTHILKPALPRYPGVVQNEALCLKLADAVGLRAAKAEIGVAEGIEYLLVERYDRTIVVPRSLKMIGRSHQEDFCQAMGIVPEQKYQSEGGPSPKQCVDLLRGVSSVPARDLAGFLDAIIFNYLIGNHDAHGKNFSLLYKGEYETLLSPPVQLAPLYDLLCTVYYPQLSPKMAMKIGDEYDSAKIAPQHFAVLAKEIGFSGKMVMQRVPEMAEAILHALPDMDVSHPVLRDIVALIGKRCESCLTQFAGR